MNRFKSMIMAIALNAPAVAAVAATANASVLQVAFTDIEKVKGTIMFNVFDSQAAYNGAGKPIRSAMIPVDKAEVSVSFEGLPAGNYAVKAFHDVNGNGKLDTNPFGMPTEPYAFSNNAKGVMGPAKWVDANFQIKSGSNRHVITIN